MKKLIPMVFVALCAVSAPAFAQDPEGPDVGKLMEKAQKLMEKLDEIVRPLLDKLQEVVQSISEELNRWIEDLNPGEMFGEFDMNRWAEELQRMFRGMQGPPEDDDERDFCMCAPIV